MEALDLRRHPAGRSLSTSERQRHDSTLITIAGCEKITRARDRPRLGSLVHFTVHAGLFAGFQRAPSAVVAVTILLALGDQGDERAGSLT
jgi:hypothetical protein